MCTVMVQMVVLVVCRLVQGAPMGPVLPAWISKVTGPEESPFAVVMVRRKLAKGYLEEPRSGGNEGT